MTTIDIGNQYEVYIHTILSKEYDQIWLTKNVPSDIVNLCNFKSFKEKFTCDIGFDLLGIKNNQFTFIQCKNYTSNICIPDLAGFFAFCACYSNRNWKFAVYYNGCLSNKIYRFIDDGANIKFTNVIYNNIIYKTNFIPRLYQLDAYNTLKYRKEKGLMYKLHMPCGMGKTYISYLLSQDYKNTIILSPLKVHAKQILNTFKKYYNDENILYYLISSDSLRKIPNLGEKNIISSTYDSCNIINKFNSFDNTLIIIDEYHNISNNHKEINYLIEHLSCPILFISATPKVEKYGNNIYEYKWKDAIDNGYISDYRIYCTDINKNYEGYLISIFGKDKLPEEYWSAYNLIYGMLLNSHSRCIIYLNSIEKCNNMKLMIKFVNIYFKKNITIMIYTSNKKLKKKNAIYEEFMKEDNIIKIICSVKILNEGIDIPICDSIYIISESLNIINIIQRICRCNRKLNNKVSGIYLWSQNVDKIKDIIINTFNDNKFAVIKYENISTNGVINTINIEPANISTNEVINTTNIAPVNISKNDVISTINIELTNNIITKSDLNIIKTEDILENINTVLEKTTLLNYLKKCPDADTLFIDDFFEFYDFNKPNDFNVDLDKLCKWLNCLKHALKNTLINTYINQVDYIILKDKIAYTTAGKPKDRIMLKPDTVKLLCMKSRAKKAKLVRNYYISLEKFIDEYKNNIIESMNKKIKSLENNQKI